MAAPRIPFDAVRRVGRVRDWARRNLEFDRATWCFAGIVALKLFALVATTAFTPSPFGALVCFGGVLLFGSVAALGRGRWRLCYLAALDLVLTLIACIDLVLLRLNDTLLDLTTLGRVFSFTTHLPMFALLLTLPPLQLVLLWLDFPLLAVAAMRWRPRSPARPLRALATAALTALALLAGGAAVDPFWSESGWQLPLAVAHAGVGTVQLFRVADSVRRSIRFRLSPPSDFKALVALAKHHRPGAAAEPATPLNVLILQVESLQSPAIGFRVEGQEVTPNLNRLAGSWLYFDRFYSQVGVGHTSDAEWLALCSQYPVDGDVAFFRYSQRELPCLPGLAKRAGARTLAFHGAEASVWNRQRMYHALAFDRFWSAEDFRGAPKLGLGVSDEWLLPHLVDALAQEQPFLAHVVTLTSHAPFEGLPEVLPLGPLAGTPLGKYLNAIHLADAAIGQMLQALEAKGLLDRTVIAIYGDHEGMSRFDPAVRALTGWSMDDRARWSEFDARVPLLLHVPNAAPRVEHSVAGQIDLAPTLARAAHYPADGSIFLGRDLLGSPAAPIVFPTGAVFSDTLLFDPELPHHHRCWAMGPLAERREPACTPLAAAAARELGLGRELVETNAFAEVLAAEAHEATATTQAP
jgi:lipoteichoic acid synthase